MGKNINRNVYVSTYFEYLDHYMIGNIKLDLLSHLIAGNINLYNNKPLYTRNIIERLIGIKIEPVDYDKNKYEKGIIDILSSPNI